MRWIFLLVTVCSTFPTIGQGKITMLIKAERLLARGDSVKALNTFKEILVQHPESFAAAHRLSELYFIKKDYYHATQYVNIALDMAEHRITKLDSEIPTNNLLVKNQKQQFHEDKARAHLLKGHIRKGQGRLKDAKEEFKKSLSHHKTLQASVDMALLLTDEGKVEEAKRLLRQLAPTEKQSTTIPFNLGNIYFKERKYDSALIAYAETIRRNPQYRLAHLYSGYAYSDIGKYQKSADSYSRYLKIDSTSNEVYFRRAVVFNQLDKPDSALLDWTKVIALDSTNQEAWRNRGLTHFKIGNYQSAISDFDKALLIAPDQAFTKINRGYSYYLLNQPKKALNDLNNGLNDLTKYNLGYYFRALVHLQMRKKKLACRDLNKALELGLDENQVDKKLWRKCH